MGVAKQTSQYCRCMLLLAVCLAVLCPATAAGSPPENPPVIKIVYPTDSLTVGPIDSTSIRGSVTPGSRLTINGQPVDVYRTGGFLVYLPVAPGPFVFRVEAENERGRTADSVRIFVTDVRPIPADSGLRITQESLRPLWNRTIRPGDEVSIGFQGTVGCRARYWVVSTNDSLGPYPMTELPHQPLATFSTYRDHLTGLGDSLPLLPARGNGQGRYHGIWRVPPGLNADTLWAIVEFGSE